MANLSRSWRSLLGQQAVTTGQKITPEQAAALRRGELEATYNITGEAEDRALRRKQIEEGLALQAANMEMQGQQFEQTMEARDREFAKQHGLNEQQFIEQQNQNRESNRIARENMDKSSSAATTSGIIQAGLALPQLYMAGRDYSDRGKLRDLEMQKTRAELDALNAKRQAVSGAPEALGPTNQIYYDYTTDPDFGKYNFGDVGSNYYDYDYYDYGDYNYPFYDYGYDYGGTNVDYNFFNDGTDWSFIDSFLGWGG